MKGLINPRAINRTLKRRSPEICAGLGIAGFFMSLVWTAVATKESVYLVEEKKEELGKDELTVKETVQTCWKQYVAPVTLSLLSAGCVVGGTYISNKRYAQLTTAYGLSTEALREYRDKVREKLGEKKEKEIREEIADDRMQATPVPDDGYLLHGEDQILCFESYTRRYFVSTPNEIADIKNRINAELVGNSVLSVNDYCSEFGLSPEEGFDEIGWYCFSKSDLLDICYGHRIEHLGKRAVVVMANREPTWDFDKFG